MHRIEAATSPFWTSVSSPSEPEGGPLPKVLGVPQVIILTSAQAKVSINWFSWVGGFDGIEIGVYRSYALKRPQ